MAKNAIARAWVLEVGEGARKYSDAPFDLVPPTAPIIAAFGTPTANTIGVQVVSPSVDIRTIISAYVVEISTVSSNGPWTTSFSVGPVQISNGLVIPNMPGATQIWVRVSGVDNSVARNRGSASNVITQTTLGGSAATGMWPNWPIMNCASHQGNSSLTYFNEANHPLLADKDLVMIQSFYPTTARLQLRISNIEAIQALNTDAQDTKFIVYSLPSVAYKNYPSTPGQSDKEVAKHVIDDATKGNERWYMHETGDETAAGRVEDFFDPPLTWAVNIGHQLSDDNSLGESYATAYWKEWDLRWVIGADDFREHIVGTFQDVTTFRPVPVYQNNGATNMTNSVDFNYDDVSEVRTRFDGSSTAGASQYSAGQLRLKAAFEARFPDKFMVPNAAEWDINYTDGGGAPLPISSHPYYRQWEIIMDEVSNNSMGLRRDLTHSTGYRYNGGGSPPLMFKNWAVMDRFVKLDANIPSYIGKGCVMGQSSMNDRVPTQDDIEFARTMSLICLLVERVCPSVQAPARVFSLDELLVQLGPPVAPRSMGTLNEATAGFTLRTADASIGVARFYWAIFEKGIVVFRGDNPTVGTWPSADAAVSVTLPSPGAGFKWQRLGTSYTNPVTGRSTRNQSPLVNTGADVTSISLRPYQCRLIRKVST